MDNILKVFAGAFALVYFYRKTLFRMLFLHFALLVFASLAVSYAELNEFLSFAVNMLALLIYVLVAITTHRVLILGESSVPEYGYKSLSKRDFRYILNCIGLGIMMIVPASLIIVPIIGGPLALFFIIYFLARFSLVLPAAAVDYPMSFADSWRATANHTLLMSVAVFLFPVLVAIPEVALRFIPYMTILANVLSLVTTVVVVAALSVAYKIIHEGNDLSLPGH